MALRVDMTGNVTGFTKMLATALTQATAFSNAVSTQINESFTKGFKGAVAGMVSFQAARSVISGVIGQVNNLRSLSDQIGTGDVEGIQKWSQAFDRAGGSVESMTRILGQFQEKREAAMGHDMAAVSARQQLESMGFSMAQINPEGGMDPLAFMQKAFGFANQSAGNSAQFESMFGPRSARYAAAGKYVGDQKAPIDQDTFEQLKETEHALDEFTKALERAAGKVLGLITVSVGSNTLQDSMLGAEKASNMLQQSINRIRAKGNTATPFEKQWLSHAIASQQPTNQTFTLHKSGDAFWSGLSAITGINFGGQVETFWRHSSPRGLPPRPSADHPAPGKQYSGPAGPNLPAIDPDAQSIMDGWKSEEQGALESLHRIQETHMTIGDRLKIINEDLAKAHENTIAVQNKLKSPTLGLSAAAFGKMTDIEKGQLRHQLTMDLLGAQSKEAELKNEKFQPPLSFQGDSMSRVGLYSASALQFSPLLGLQQQANHYLAVIAGNTSRPGGHTPSDPHRP